MSDREWFVPASGLTAAMTAFVVFAIPDRSGIGPALTLFPYWMLASAVLAMTYGLGHVMRMMMAGVPHPIAILLAEFRNRWKASLRIVAGVALAGLNMVTFMWIKPFLNYLVPFKFDRFFADLDRLIFAGIDPWQLIGWMNSELTARLYHRGWFALMILVLIMTLAQEPSARKSAVMMTYFALWSIFGPLVHLAMPAAGPVFYTNLGLGNRFTGITELAETKEIAEYLWRVYSHGGFGPGAGISAMPSLHIATTAWMVIAVGAFKKTWLLPMSAAGLLIFLLSISLGWHYAVDGLAGCVGAAAFYLLFLRIYQRELPRGNEELVPPNLGIPMSEQSQP